MDWFPPMVDWTKCNTDGLVRGNPGSVASGGIFRDSNGTVTGCFSAYLGISSALHAEYIAAMMAIEIAHQKGWHSLWLECDSKVVVDAFIFSSRVPWQLHNRWGNCKVYCQSMNFRVSYREGNSCAYGLVNFGVTSQGFQWWNNVPNFIMEDFFCNRLGLPNYIFN